MIDLPPESLQVQEQVIETSMQNCGMETADFIIQYEDILQGFEILIRDGAGVDASQFPCIHEATRGQFVSFENEGMQSAYSDYSYELIRPVILQSAEKELRKLKLLKSFPNRADYEDDLQFAKALERLCDVEPGSALKKFHGKIALMPDRELSFQAFNSKYGCLMAALQFASARNEIDYVFVGNGAFREAPGK
ncbi:hypothetical protein [Novosphingopyxis sp.]|uniref:hypothetical protein n=1 Tax=Novosphingopyxis sp. TaxID=2709690 RepID=UPI003B58FEDE